MVIKQNIGSNLGRRKRGIKISKEANKFVFEWQLYFERWYYRDEKIYKQEIVLNLETKKLGLAISNGPFLLIIEDYFVKAIKRKKAF
nr:hypothetical protein [Mycoplasmopsis bovis]